MKEKDVIIIGGGPAGLAAAAALYKKGIHDVLILEREKNPGGILRQCIHDGFGLTRFHETLSGPEYAQRFLDEIEKYHIPYLTDTMVLGLKAGTRKIVTAASRSGLEEWSAKAVILAMGCRERTRGALGIPGERPAGVFTAGTAQAYMNLYNRMPGKEIIILGSGDIGMIMARRLTLEGAHVQAVFEVLPYASGLPRNVEQCLNDYGIPLYLSHTVTEIHGDARLKGVTVSEVDSTRTPIPGTEKFYACDTLILSVGLIPENELTSEAGGILDLHTNGAVVDENFQTSLPGVFAAGNVLHVHDLVDFVSLEAEKLADSAARYILGEPLRDCPLKISAGSSIGHVVPQRISGKTDFLLSLRVSSPHRNGRILVQQGNHIVAAHEFRRAVPAEMLQIKIPAANINCTEDLEVSVE
jgi:NADPH-dependent 2,4-dienoyl-CoA reductase/sulfur reductase-like enzyme